MTVFTCLAKTAHEICARHQCICASVKLGVVFRQEEAKPLTSSVTYAWDIEMHRHKKQDLDMALGDQINPLLPTARGWVPTACALRRALDSWEAIGDTQINHSTIAQLPCLTYQWCETPLDRIAFADASIACWKEYQNCHE